MSENKNYAVIDSTGLVVNVVVWDGETEWSPGDGFQAVQSDVASIGWTYANGVFTPPPPPPVVPPSPAEILATNTATRNQYLAAATLAIAPLQDAIDIGEATDDDVAMLAKWKKFRVEVNRVVLTQQNPVWPIAPQPGYGAAIVIDPPTS